MKRFMHILIAVLLGSLFFAGDTKAESYTKYMYIRYLIGMADAADEAKDELALDAVDKGCPALEVDKSSGYCVVPDPALTPGEMDSSLACVSNKDRPRQVSSAEKDLILRAYGYDPATFDKSQVEFDHWYPHWMGGSDTPKNIWPEFHQGKFGSLAKDKVELYLFQQVCTKKAMTLDPAKKAYLRGWTGLAGKH